jgi:prophage regulatory protein
MTTQLLEDLVTGAEVARRLKLSRERVRQLAQRPDFPEPLGRVGQAVVWRWPDVDEWARQREAAKLER